ncbi:unnamed protein product [Anisakis simplex]|uniref:Anoctamin n=1 Tax=Anisakis simplex TaxID=6269 RepID=A0A0M3KH19_ANISI|nr:unnamed protein product [Anisakis simplex]
MAPGPTVDSTMIWQMQVVICVSTIVTCFFLVWTMLLINANLMVWPLVVNEMRLKMIRDNEYELVHCYKRELLLSHLFQSPDEENIDEEHAGIDHVQR